MEFTSTKTSLINIEDIPNIPTYPLQYVFENLKIEKNPKELWIEFGVASGRTINYISEHTQDTVYGFDSFEGLPEGWVPGFDKGTFSSNGSLPEVNTNVELVVGLFQNTLSNFLKEKNKKISFIHIDCDLYSSTKFIFNEIKPYISKNCVVVFDEMVGIPYENSELRAFQEFTNENTVKYEWIGCYEGTQPAALIIKSIT